MVGRQREDCSVENLRLNGELKFEWVSTNDQLADVLTKNQTEEIHTRAYDRLMGARVPTMKRLHKHNPV